MSIANPPQGGYNLPGSIQYTPDYQALIENDPAFMALKNSLSAQDISNAAQRAAATQQALIQFGAVPDFSGIASQLGLSPEALAMLQGDLGNAGDLANANTKNGLSTEAQLQQQQQQAILGLRNALAARGALGSGDTGYRTGLQNQAYAKAQNDALAALLSAINGYQSSYLNQKNDITNQLNTGMSTAEQFEAGLPQNQGFTLKYDAKHGVYRDASGNTYTVHANGDGTWTLTNSATGGTYTLGADGKLTNGTGNSNGNGNPPPPNGGGIPNVPPNPFPDHNPAGTPPPGPPNPFPNQYPPPNPFPDHNPNVIPHEHPGQFLFVNRGGADTAGTAAGGSLGPHLAFPPRPIPGPMPVFGPGGINRTGGSGGIIPLPITGPGPHLANPPRPIPLPVPVI